MSSAGVRLHLLIKRLPNMRKRRQLRMMNMGRIRKTDPRGRAKPAKMPPSLDPGKRKTCLARRSGLRRVRAQRARRQKAPQPLKARKTSFPGKVRLKRVLRQKILRESSFLRNKPPFRQVRGKNRKPRGKNLFASRKISSIFSYPITTSLAMGFRLTPSIRPASTHSGPRRGQID